MEITKAFDQLNACTVFRHTILSQIINKSTYTSKQTLLECNKELTCPCGPKGSIHLPVLTIQKDAPFSCYNHLCLFNLFVTASQRPRCTSPFQFLKCSRDHTHTRSRARFLCPPILAFNCGGEMTAASVWY